MAKAKDPKPKAAEPPPAEAPPAYTVVARRYRPQQFADLIGQEHIAQALTNALTAGRVAQAYLFTGARGVGKTSTARILAKALNCEHGPTPTPCDQCQTCLSIAGGDDVDAVEIDGASNNKVEEARDLRQNVGFKPARSRFKIYIIDEVHMLSAGAFNALLKTIEEPPPHVKFILATTEIQKIPVTILSRCQRFDFNTVGPAKIFETLKHIAKKEGLTADDDALQLVARRANGSMRDSQTLLDQLLGVCGGELTTAKVHELLGTAADDRVLGLAEAILTGDAKQALALVGEAAERGLQLGELLDQLIEYWRGLMLANVGGMGIDPMLGSAAVRERIAAHAAGKNLDTILAGLDILSLAKGRMKATSSPLVLMEVAVVRLSRLEDLMPVADLTQWLQQGVKSGTVVPNASLRPAATPSAIEPAKKKPLTPPEAKSNGLPAGENGETLEANWPSHWAKILEDLRQNQVLVGSLQRLPNLPAIIGPNALAVRCPSAYTAVYETLKSERNTEQLRQALRRLNGKDWTVLVEKGPDAAPVQAERPKTTAEPTLVPVGPPMRQKEMLGLPFFKALTDVLGAQLMRTEDGFDPTTAPATVAAIPVAADDPDDPLPQPGPTAEET